MFVTLPGAEALATPLGGGCMHPIEEEILVRAVLVRVVSRGLQGFLFRGDTCRTVAQVSNPEPAAKPDSAPCD